ncbi:hypothetical protein F5X97DRAFT_324918 [Nemania serpens]|nr:hypothetical protein F5X97DRAFT_324918 [Nemania serpens]
MPTIWEDAAANPPRLTTEDLARYAKGNRNIINELDPATGLTPLAAAIRAGNATTVKLLLDNNADPDKKTRDGFVPMYLAASSPVAKQRPRMVQLLLEKYPKTFDESGPASVKNDTPLMAAVRNRDAGVIKLLVEQGASKTKKNADGKTAPELANEGKPAGLDVDKALQLAATKGRGAIQEYVDNWVLQVLGHYDIWSPLGGVVEAAGQSVYDIVPPKTSDDDDEEVAEPQTAADFKKNIDKAIEKGGLGRFYPPGDPYPQQVADKAFEIKNDPNNPLNEPRQVDAMAKMALYQPVLYCDDSWSMWVEEDHKGTGERWRAQVELVKRISDITTRAVPDKRGCHLRFINKNTPTYNNLNKDQITNIMANFPESNGWTPIGTMLRQHVLDPFVYPELNSKTIKRPLLVLITTDGYPTAEKGGNGVPVDENRNMDPDRFRKEIRDLGKELVRQGYRRDVVRFSISQIGKKISYTDDEQKVKEFLDGIESDDTISDIINRTVDIMDARYDELRYDEKKLQTWLLGTLLSPLRTLLLD